MKKNIILSVTFGLTSTLIAFLIHALWGDLQTIFYTMVNGFIIGFFIGLCEPMFAHSAFKKLPYTLVLLFRSVAYFLISIICIYIIFIMYLTDQGMNTQDLNNPEKFKMIQEAYFLANFNMLYVFSMSLIGSFMWQLKSFFGKHVLRNYLSGKYHKPSIETRIFMFLDLNNATTLAEKLDSRTYSSLLKDFFNDIDEAITQSKGAVYQYVGDEVVVIWKVKSGLTQYNCIQTFYNAKHRIESNQNTYKTKYGEIPSFKASIHMGEVTITEIGTSKKEIVYHGDTMNSAARLCSMAHQLNQHLIISKDLKEHLAHFKNLEFHDLDYHSIKGKQEKMHLFTVKIKESSCIELGNIGNENAV